MPRAGLVDILDAMADQITNALAAVTDLDFQIEPRLLPNPSGLAIDMYPGNLGRDADSAAFDDISGGYFFTVRARVAPNDFDAVQDLILGFMDDTSDICLAAALLDEPSLNGYASSLDVRDVTGYTPYEDVTGGVYIGFQFSVLVLPGDS